MKLIYSIHKYDVFMFTWLVNARIHAELARFSRYISKTADGPFYLLLATWFYFQEGPEGILFQIIAFSFLIERPAYMLLKNGLKRNRPEAALKNFRSVITPSDRFSFPSGHTSAAFMMATLVGYFYPVLLPVFYGWATLVGFSRVVLGVHFPTDTLVGAALGIGTAIFSLEYFL